MVETTFTTEFAQGPIPAGFHIQLEGNFITIIGQNGSGKTSLLYALFRKNMENGMGGKDQICLISLTGKIEDRKNKQTLEQYNSELAKSIEENNGRRERPNSGELFRLLLNHNNLKTQVQRLNSYSEYLGLPKCEIHGEGEIIFQPKLNILPGSFSAILTILAALTDDYIKMVLIDEPGVYLHLNVQKLLRELLREASKTKQIIIATHSNEFVNNEITDAVPNVVERPTRTSQTEKFTKALHGLAKQWEQIAPNWRDAQNCEWARMRVFIGRKVTQDQHAQTPPPPQCVKLVVCFFLAHELLLGDRYFMKVDILHHSPDNR